MSPEVIPDRTALPDLPYLPFLLVPIVRVYLQTNHVPGKRTKTRDFINTLRQFSEPGGGRAFGHGRR